MKNLFLIVFMFPWILNAQLSKKFNIELSKSYKVEDAQIKEYVPVSDGKFVISIKYAGKDGFYIQKFDVNGMKEVAHKHFDEFQKGERYIGNLYLDDDHFYFYYEVFDKKVKAHTVYMRKVNVSDCSLSSKKEIFKTKAEVTHDPGSSYKFVGMQTTSFRYPRGFHPRFTVFTSFDKSKILIASRDKPIVKNDKNNSDIIGMRVFDTEMNLVWEDEKKMPYTEAEMNNAAFGVANSGEVYLLSVHRERKEYELLLFSEKELEKQSLDIEADLFFQKLEIRQNAKGNPVVAGYYARGLDYKFGLSGGTLVMNVDGIYLFEIEKKDGKVIHTKKIEFPLAFIKQYLNDRQREKLEKREAEGKAGIQGLVNVDFHLQDDGSMILIGEQNYIMNEPWMMSLSEMVHHYSNIVATKLDSDGKVLWMKKLPKNQAKLYSSMGNNGLGVKYIQGDDYHWFLYLDNEDNAKLAINEVPASHKNGLGGFLTVYRVNDKTGEVDKHILFDIKDIKGRKLYQFEVTRIFEVDGGFMLETYLKDKQDAMVKLWMDQ